MVEHIDYTELNTLILEYFNQHGMKECAETFLSERRKKASISDTLGGVDVMKKPQTESDLKNFPDLYQKFVEDKIL